MRAALPALMLLAACGPDLCRDGETVLAARDFGPGDEFISPDLPTEGGPVTVEIAATASGPAGTRLEGFVELRQGAYGEGVGFDHTFAGTGAESLHAAGEPTLPAHEQAYVRLQRATGSAEGLVHVDSVHVSICPR